ncbi:hypothetical protein DPMN_065877 [Dreissena polymorpha]|uniref:HIG1 domain-containing protein n=1 Tax=Dreissena polymorpha TaxID=45954 RepID=A0A9D4BRL7_DREPO|nr:hypothetical protein DPMN_065877 [Dreissena polymorpha]
MDKESQSSSVHDPLIYLSEKDRQRASSVISQAEYAGYKSGPIPQNAHVSSFDFDKGYGSKLGERPSFITAYPVTVIGLAACFGIVCYGVLRRNKNYFSDQSLMNICWAAQVGTVLSFVGHRFYHDSKKQAAESKQLGAVKTLSE